mmetsp:Transcript_104219/g.325026  ORF Transcript_104219/g.325026 Transcript_104219/m.325026 type:complete len:329 (-) Transcript_104219:187-1173(-)|eukprot:CAMPEP_0204575156 /NCGR_PEP_ID=MMETSP0661-20131031/41020_1 /ASSEMBLY_ACC=CAM_ASM_000606 /TAXON_ID=109239 /ORGANISM="Alexandrium margalefi, Strain AMGDE01CS-322" /LENGTH=328 /DNA_ID=CAMNT_0051583749 /DNA_START=163 /DNA_END=1149 /DNA_ORIENTATION=-
MDGIKAFKPEWRGVYEAPWPIFALAWSSQPRARPRLAVGSFLDRSINRVRVVELGEAGRFDAVAEVEQPYPATKIMFKPEEAADQGRPDLLAASSTMMNLWSIEEGQAKPVATLANARSGSVSTPPLTSFDWSPNQLKIATSSVDTTVTIWNVEKQKIETQLIAHDKAVFDVAYSGMDHLFASVGADGSLRLFDVRDLDRSVIVYEASPASPLLRLAWNKLSRVHLATVAMDAAGVTLIDIRMPLSALASMTTESCVNHFTWAPHSRNHLLCGQSDGLAVLWDVKDMPAKADAAAYDSAREVLQVQWPASQPDHIVLGMSKQLEVLRV